MKRTVKLIVCLLSFTFILSLHQTSALAATTEELKESWYDTRYYPIYPGGPEWQKHSLKDVVYINNPPFDLLFSMPSDELAKLLLECPDLSQITVYYGEDGSYAFDQFFGFLEANSDIFFELLRRNDGIAAILTTYENSGIDTQWFASMAYDQSETDLYKWYAEVFGSQFVHLYSDMFTAEETELAKKVINEKNKLYDSTENADPVYFNRSDIEGYAGNTAGHIGAKFMTESKLLQREKSFVEAEGELMTIGENISAEEQLEETNGSSEPNTEQSNTENQKTEISEETAQTANHSTIVYIVIACIFIVGLVALGILSLRKLSSASKSSH